MRVVYEAEHVIDAHLVRHALEAEGIPAFVRGEALLGGLGELGVFGLVAVCVPDAAWLEARGIVERLAACQPDMQGEAVEGAPLPPSYVARPA